MVGRKGQKTPGNPNIKNYGFGTRPREVDDEYRRRARGVPKWTKERCITELNDLLDVLKKVLKDNKKIEKDDPKKLKDERVRDCITLMNKILDYVKYLYPPIEKSVNVNIDMTADIIMERLKNWKKKKEVVVFDKKKLK